MKSIFEHGGLGSSRRVFLRRAVLAASSLGWPVSSFSADTQQIPPIVVFSKIYQTLNLNFREAAEVTAEAGADGADCPVRPGGEVLPESVSGDLPRYAEALRERGLRLPLLTTAITSVSSPNVETILRTAKAQGVQFYRLGFIDRRTEMPVEKQLGEVKAALKDLAALNAQIKIGAVIQNHSPDGSHAYLGGDLGELYELVKDYDPAQIGAAFDIGHALIVHKDDWRRHFDKIKSHLKIAYVKDANRDGRWVRFGEGEVGKSGYFKILKGMGYKNPISLHIEFDWSDNGKAKSRKTLVNAMRDSSRTLKEWFATA